jgi:kanamycin kinase
VTATPIPADVRERFAGWTAEVVYAYAPHQPTYRLTSADGELRYLKIQPVGGYPGLPAEAARTRWAAGWLPVPEVLELGSDGEVDWLLTRALAGRDATAAQLRADPARLVPLLAEGLRQFHELPVDECPFGFRVDDALADAGRRVEAGLIDPAEHLHAEYRHLGAEGALAELVRLRPAGEDEAVCHGDYCLPNVFLTGARVSGFLDLGELGVADRWWDLAVGAWSVTWNCGPGWEELFYRAYGVTPEPDRITFYRLLYDLSS